MKTEARVSVIVPGRTSWPSKVISAAGGVVALLAVPLAVLVIGVPVALLLRGLIDAAQWIVAMFAR